MKTKEILIEGFSSNISPDDRPCISAFGLEGCGKTRFAATMPDPIGLLAIDKKSKRTFERIAIELKKIVIANEKPIITDKEALKIALEVKTDEVKKVYTEVYQRALDLTMRLAEHKDIQSVVIDTNSQLFEYILFAHFGRRTQIPPTSRGAANQDMIDLVNALRSKNVCLIHRAKETWKKVGVDKNGNPISEPTGKYKADGFSGMGGFCTATLEFINNNKKVTSDVDEKFRVKVVTCQTNSMLEGQDLNDYGVAGEGITWDNVITALGVEA